MQGRAPCASVLDPPLYQNTVYVLDLQLQSIIYKVNIELVSFDVITVNVKDNTHYYYNVIKLFTRVCSVCYFCPNFSDSSPQTSNIYVLRCK